MFRIKVGLLVLSATLMLGACGEKFRAMPDEVLGGSQATTDGGNQADTNAGTNTNVTSNNIVSGVTPLSIDQGFANHYTHLTSNDSLRNQIVSVVKAFSLEKNLSQPSTDKITLSAKIHRSCSDTILVQGIVDISAFRVGQRFALRQQNGPYSVELQCNNQGCDEMSAIIRYTEAQVEAGVLVGLIRNSSANGNSVSRHILEATRSPNVNGYAIFTSTDDYATACAAANNGGNGGTTVFFDPNQAPSNPAPVNPAPVNSNPVTPPPANNGSGLSVFF